MSKISYNNIFSSPSSHLIKDILLLLGDCVFFLKKLETKPFFGGGGGREGGKQGVYYGKCANGELFSRKKMYISPGVNHLN